MIGSCSIIRLKYKSAGLISNLNDFCSSKEKTIMNIDIMCCDIEFYRSS